jgi:Ca2+-dependent lipid-binding protein
LLKVHVLRAEKLPKSDKGKMGFGKAKAGDPYVKVSFGDADMLATKPKECLVANDRGEKQTKVRKETCEPSWMDGAGSTEVFELVVPDDAASTGKVLRVEVYDDDGKLATDDFLGLVDLEGGDLTAAMQKGADDEQSFGLKADEVKGAKKKKYNQYVDGEGAIVVKMELTEQVQVECKSASDLRVADANLLGKATSSDPYCKVFWNDALVHKTKHVPSSVNPDWTGDDNKFQYWCRLPYQVLRLEMFDKDTFTKNDFHGQVTIRSDAFSSFDYGEKAHPLCPKPGKEGGDTQGSVTVNLQMMDRLLIHVVNAMSLSAAADVSWTGKKKAGDPYVKVFHNGSQVGKKTKTKNNSTDCVWNEYRETYIPKDCSTQKLRFELYDHDMINLNMGKDELLGLVELEGAAIKELVDSDGGFKPFKLQKEAGSRGQDIQMGWLGLRLLATPAQ